MTDVPRIIEIQADQNVWWLACSECGEELFDVSVGDGGSHMECGTCGHGWWEGEYISPNEEGQSAVLDRRETE